MQADKLATPSRSALGLLLAAALLSSPALLAQGLGELRLDSALNEPLRASIELLDVAGLEQGQLIISIASTDEYESAGLERNGLLAQIEFDVQLQPAGSSSVTLTTRDRVTEPYLSLLVSARWPSGRVLRDYTVLLDLPAAAAPGAAAPAAGAQPLAMSRVTAPEAGPEQRYTVQSGDSLWQIAEQRRPGPDVSVPQMMIALQRANEDAFVNNNINRLVSGRVLRIPTREEIAIIEPAAAVAQVNAQNLELGLVPLAGSGAAAAGSRDELSVLGGDAATAGAGGSSDLDATIAALEAELMLSEEELDRARLENQELTLQLGELEEQIAILQNIIAIEDERIAQLQNELASQLQATDQALAEASRAAEVLAASGQTAPQGLAGRVLALLQDNLVLIGGALAVVLALLGLLVAKTRRAREAAEADAFLLDTGMDEASPQAAERFQALDAAADAALDEELAQASGLEPEAPQGFLARLRARFQRRQEEFADDDESGFADYEEFEASAERVDDEPEEQAGYEVELEIDDAADAELATQESAEAAAPTAAPETFEFKVAPPPPPPAEPEPQPGIESFAFTLEPRSEPAAESAPEATPAADAVPVLETFEFKPVAAQDSFDPSALSFDEHDAQAAEEEESVYTPRSSMDECDTKLDLAVAYEAMGDLEGAIEILDEVIAEGKPAQVEEAQRLKASWQNA